MTERDNVQLQASVLDYIHDAVTAIDERLVFIAFNRAAEKLYGWKASEVLGRYVYDVLPSDAAPAQRAEIMHALAETGRCHVEAVHYRKDGRPVQVEGNILALHGTRGQITGYVSVLRDVTQYRRAEKALRESEARYRSLVDASPDAIVLTDLKANVLMVNSRAAALLGFGSAREIIGKNAFDFIVEADQPHALNNLRRTLETGSVRDVEYTALKKDGTPFPIELSASLIVSPKGEPQAFTAVLRDITERKQAEQALRQSEERYRLVTRATNDVIWDWNMLAGEVVWNEALHTVYGYTPEAASSTIDEAYPWWYDRIHPADREKVATSLDGVIAGGGAAWSGEYRFRRADGSYATVFDRGYISRNEQGEPVRMVGSMLDITARRQAEEAVHVAQERLQHVLASSPAVIYVLKIKGDTFLPSWVSENVTQMLGYAPQEALTAHWWVDQLHPEDRARVLSEQSLPFPNDRLLRKYRLRHKDGSYRWIRDETRLLRDTAGQPAEAIGSWSDITERKRAEQEITARVRQQAAVAELGRLALEGADLSALMSEAAARVAQILEVEYCGVLEMLPDGSAFRLRAGVGWQEGRVGHAMVSAGTHSQAGYALLVDESVIVQDLRTETRFDRPALLFDHGVVSGMSVIIRGKEHPFGILGAHTAQRRIFTQDDVYFLRGMANVLAAAIERKRTEEEMRRQAARAEALAHAAERLNAQLDLETVLHAACEETVRALSVPIAAIYLSDTQRDVLCFAAGYGLPPNWSERVSPLPQATYEEFIGRQGTVTVIPDVQTLATLLNADLSIELDARTAATAAMFQEEQLIGFLGVFTTGAVRQFTPDELSLLKSLADQVALAIVDARLFAEARESRKRLQFLSWRLLAAHETERRHIARELHDEIGQTLTGLKLLIDMCARLPARSIPAKLAQAQALLNGLMDRVHNLSLDLRPTMLDDLGLLPALLSHLERYTAQTGVHIAFQHTGLDRRFAPEVETAAYRIVQEALTNVARHAGVREVKIHLWADADALCVQVEDQGAGFDTPAVLAARRSSGLAGMHERTLLLGGQLTIESTPGAGTLVLAELPLAGLPDGGDRPV